MATGININISTIKLIVNDFKIMTGLKFNIT